MSCRVLGGPDFGSSLKGMGLLYRNLWGSGLSRKRVPIIALCPKNQTTTFSCTPIPRAYKQYANPLFSPTLASNSTSIGIKSWICIQSRYVVQTCPKGWRQSAWQVYSTAPLKMRAVFLIYTPTNVVYISGFRYPIYLLGSEGIGCLEA